jgi:hypothetical protein
MQATAELSTQQLSDRLNVSTRMINIYRAAVEMRTGQAIGIKRGRTTYFSGEEQDLIAQAQAQGNQRKEPETKPPVNEAQDNQMVGDMGAMMRAGDASAIAIGQQIGERWQALMFQAASTQMMGGLTLFKNQMEEFNVFTQISGAAPTQLEGGSVYLESSEDDND